MIYFKRKQNKYLDFLTSFYIFFKMLFIFFVVCFLMGFVSIFFGCFEKEKINIRRIYEIVGSV